MRRDTTPRQRCTAGLLMLALAVGLASAGCTSLAQDVANHLAEKDVKALDQEFHVFEGDLALFRQCLKARGGTCDGTDATALAHSSQATGGQSVTPVSGGSSATLAAAVAQLPAGDPARGALAVMGHPVVGQAAALHDHLRGHGGAAAPGLSAQAGHSPDGTPQTTITMSLGLSDLQGLHKGLLTSVTSSGWDSLHERCEGLLAASAVPDQPRLEAECRRVAFVRGYLEAYLRRGQFLEVDVQLAGAIQAVDEGAVRIEAEIQDLEEDLRKVAAKLTREKSQALRQLSGATGKVGGDVEALIQKVEADLERRFGAAVSEIFGELSGLTREIDEKSAALAQAADMAVAKDVQSLIADLDGLLGKVKAALGKLDGEVASAGQKVVQDINAELGRADAALSNVFKISNVGFVSRDHTFQARLPTIEVTLDPTVKQLVKLTDVDTGQALTGASDVGDLGMATDTSGIGTGSSIGAEIVRIFLEAVFDAHEGLPAVAPANQPNVKPTGLTLGQYSLPLFTAPMGNVSAADLSRMTYTNDRVAASTRAIVSRIIAGIGPFSLNNPPLEEFLVEIIATSVRQATAKATWCWYACDLDQDAKTLETDARAAIGAEVKAVEDKVGAEAAKIEGEEKAKADEVAQAARKRATEAAEQVKLRLKLSR